MADDHPAVVPSRRFHDLMNEDKREGEHPATCVRRPRSGRRPRSWCAYPCPVSDLLALAAGAAVAAPLALGGGYALGRRPERPPQGETRGAATAVAAPSLIDTPAASTTDLVPRMLSQDAARLLRLLRSGWLLVDRSDRVVASSEDASALGLVRDVDLRHEEMKQVVRLARRERRTVEGDLDLPRGPIDDARVDLGVRVTPLNDDLVVVLVEDRTQARRIEETRRDFVVNVSHELKTPVGGLRLLAEAVEDAADDAEAVARFAGRMKTETVRLANLVQEIVDLSRLQGADTVAAAKPVDLGECAVRATEETRLLAESRNIEVLLRADEESHVVLGDENLLTTAIRNLVSNAVNYSPADTRISVVVTTDDDDVAVQVTDQGIGLSAADVERIFERFYRVDPARSRQTGGTGLGLAIVKHVCANHGGRIRVWSEPGVGSTFEMQFPCWSAEREHHLADPDAPLTPSARPVLATSGAPTKEVQ